jgi:hypothetical protein
METEPQKPEQTPSAPAAEPAVDPYREAVEKHLDGETKLFLAPFDVIQQKPTPEQLGHAFLARMRAARRYSPYQRVFETVPREQIVAIASGLLRETGSEYVTEFKGGVDAARRAGKLVQRIAHRVGNLKCGYSAVRVEHNGDKALVFSGLTRERKS